MAYDPERAHKKLTEEQVRPLAERQWDNAAIAAYLGVSIDTLKRQYAPQIREWKRVGQCYLLDRAWQKIQSNRCPERLFIEMMKRYVWKTHMDKLLIKNVDGDKKEKDERLVALYNEIQDAVKTQSLWTSQAQSQPSQLPSSDSQSPMGLLNPQSNESMTISNNIEEISEILENDMSETTT